MLPRVAGHSPGDGSHLHVISITICAAERKRPADPERHEFSFRLAFRRGPRVSECLRRRIPSGQGKKNLVSGLFNIAHFLKGNRGTKPGCAGAAWGFGTLRKSDLLL